MSFAEETMMSADDERAPEASTELPDQWGKVEPFPFLPRAEPGGEEGADEPLPADFFLADDAEPFELPGAARLGIVGGKGVGKSYLFQAMVYRTLAGGQAGALATFLHRDSIRLWSALRREDPVSTLNITAFLRRYAAWQRLPTTTLAVQRWYRLRLRYRTGLLGRRRSALDVEFFDGSGEGFFAAVQSSGNGQLWRDGFLDARMMVFCLPLWVAFPVDTLSAEDRGWREQCLEGFDQVVQNVEDLRGRHRRTAPVRTLLALTMGDDPRCALTELRERWIHPYLDTPFPHLRRLRTPSGLMRYLVQAGEVSRTLGQEFERVRDPRVAGIPQRLDLGAGPPWLIPLSAIEGTVLGQEERGTLEAPTSPPRQPPVPAHVELPLLVALCEHTNALM